MGTDATTITGKKIDFWQDHSLHYLEMAHATDRIERLESFDGYGSRTGDCGDTIEIFLTVKDKRIHRVSFIADGCMNTRACANTVARMAEGHKLKKAWSITSGAVVHYLKTLPADDTHCAELAVGALYLALSDYERKTGKPIKLRRPSLKNRASLD